MCIRSNSSSTINIFSENEHFGVVCGSVSPWSESDQSSIQDFLTTDEAYKASRFKFVRDRQLYVLSHAVARALISKKVGCDASDLWVCATDLGKPFVKSGPNFNWTHSGTFYGIALHQARVVGIDVSVCLLPDMQANAEQFMASIRDVLSGSEAKAISGVMLQAGPPRTKLISGMKLFHRIWAVKEAVVKAAGLGLNFDPRRVCVNITAANEPAGSLENSRGSAPCSATDIESCSVSVDGTALARGWSVASAWLDAAHAVALAIGPRPSDAPHMAADAAFPYEAESGLERGGVWDGEQGPTAARLLETMTVLRGTPDAVQQIRQSQKR